MNFKQFYLTEMPVIKKTTVGPDSEMDEKLKYRYELFKTETKKDTFKKDGIEYILFDGPSSLWFFLDNETPIGFSGFRGLDDDYYNFVRLGTLYVTPKYRNKGIATELYKYLVEKYEGIVSDYELSKNNKFGSFYIYEKLLKIFNVYESYYHDLKKIKSVDELKTVNRHSVLIVSKKELL
jgi:GNAT superfamily N-acetyltransferase